MRRSRPAFRTTSPQMGPQAPSRFKPNMPMVPPRNPQQAPMGPSPDSPVLIGRNPQQAPMGPRPNMPMVPPRNPQADGAGSAKSIDGLSALQLYQDVVRGTPMQAKPPGLKKGGAVKAKKKTKKYAEGGLAGLADSADKLMGDVDAMADTINYGSAKKQELGLGAVTGMKKGGTVKSSASKRADGCAIRGKTRA